MASKEAFEVLSNDEGSVAQQLSEDADRLVFTFDKFSAKTKDQKQSQEMRLLQRLARKTFGSGGDDSSPIVTPVKKPSRAKKQKEGGAESKNKEESPRKGNEKRKSE